MDDWDGLAGLFVVLIIIAVVVYIIFLIASALAAVASGAGVLWGGGTAIVNYSKSFKENMIDSNLAAA